VKARVAGLRTLLGRALPYAEAAAALRRGFAGAWGATFEVGEPTSAELERAHVLAAEKYGTAEWKFRR
jgi:lipoate-protein ligase A